MEKYIGFTIMLFLLSMICERLADYLKHFIGEQNTMVAVWLKKIFRIGDTIDKGITNSVQEDKRYYRILKLNIVCGFIVAVALHADLFTILSHLDKPEDAITWDGYEFNWLTIDHKSEGSQSIFLFLLGCFFTGLFISFGSKVWHDLLDLLLEVKNARRKLNDERTYTIPQSIKEFDTFVSTREGELAQLAYAKYRNAYQNQPGITGIGKGYMDTPRGKIGCLEIHFSNEKLMQTVPNMVQIELETMLVPVPVNKIYCGKAIIHAGVFGAGNAAANDSKLHGWGAFGCVVEKKNDNSKRYLLSSYHVLSSTADYSGPETNTRIIIRQNKKKSPELPVGFYAEGYLSPTMDAALALIDSTETFTNSKINNPQEIRNITGFDVKEEMPVKFFSAERNAEYSGIIYNDSWKQTLDYGTKLWDIEDLIVLTRKIGVNLNSISVPGDSGSLIRDKDNKAIGIVVGGDDCFTYAIKMTTIETDFAIKLL